ncbi:MAG: hypothetical protein JWQ87_3875 [Candidatus Sulfotelmatobacter sp.]|nr:hypothetical protein [Candidatus Sulfotelmatobacter sp.]
MHKAFELEFSRKVDGIGFEYLVRRLTILVAPICAGLLMVGKHPCFCGFCRFTASRLLEGHMVICTPGRHHCVTKYVGPRESKLRQANRNAETCRYRDGLIEMVNRKLQQFDEP